MATSRVSDTIEGSAPCWKLGHSRSSSSRGRANKNANAYTSEFGKGFGGFHADSKNLEELSRQDAAQKQHIVGYGKRNYHEKFASTVFTDTYEEDITKGPRQPHAQLVRPNSQLGSSRST
eukprot:3232212-Pyramimonas_sp.AAC.1